MIDDQLMILGLQPLATEDQLKQAYRKLSKKFHPDVNKSAGAIQKFQEISNAYEYLKKHGTNPSYAVTIEIPESNQTDEYESWRISVRENRKKKIKEREAYRLALLINISRYTRVFNFLIIIFCLFILTDHAFSTGEEKMKITQVNQHYETVKRSKRYMLDIIYFGELKLVCEKGSINKVSNQYEVTVCKNLLTNSVKYIKFTELNQEIIIRRLPYLRFFTIVMCSIILLFNFLYFKIFINEEIKLSASVLVIFFSIALLIFFINY